MKTLIKCTKDGIEKYLSEVLGDDKIKNRSIKYEESLKGIGIHGIRKFILSLLDKKIPAEIVDIPKKVEESAA